MKHNPKVEAEIGGRIRDMRKSKAISLETVGARVSVTYQQMQKYETGRNRVSASTLLDIADAMGCSPVALLLPPERITDLALDDADFRRLSKMPIEKAQHVREMLRAAMDMADLHPALATL